MALRPEIENLVRFDIVNDVGELFRIGEIAIMQKQFDVWVLWVLINMIDAGGVEGARATNYPVNLITLGE